MSTIEEIRKKLHSANTAKWRIKKEMEDPIAYKQMIKEKNHKQYLKHREKDIANSIKWNLAHPERVKELKRQSYQRHKERKKAERKEWWKIHGPGINAKRRKKNAKKR